MLVWGNDQNADRTVETVTQAMLGDRQVWRVTHYDQDPTSTVTNDYDLYDLDAVTLAPLRSISNREGSQLQVTFSEHEVTIRTKVGAESAPERIAVSMPVKPEGPGLTAMVASLPLAIGYRTRYQIVDRWDGQGISRLKTVTLSVLGRQVEATALGKKEVYAVLIKPDDGSFQITERVLAKAPHFAIKVEYVRGKRTYVSEVSLAIGN
jgi:hypothetical protein